jgi:hypothetical protein
MTEIYGGKMAFPIHNTGHGAPFDEGMSLRDYVAIHAMQAIISRADTRFDTAVNFVSGKAYQYADAMIEHRVSGEQ